MAITHVRFVHSKIPPDWEPLTFEELEKDRHVLLVDMVPEGTETRAGQMYRELDPAIKRTDCVVLRGAWPHINQVVLRDPALREEVGDRPAMALVGGMRPDHPGPALVELPGFRPVDPPLSMESLRQAELEALLSRTGAIFADDSSHYGLPSTRHAEKFIRLADALRSLHDVSRVADWVMEYVTSETVVIADTGSLLPLLYHLREEAARRFRWRIEIASLDGYPNDKISIIDAVAAIKNRPEIAWRLASVAEPQPPPTTWRERFDDWWRRLVLRVQEEWQTFRGGRRRRGRGVHLLGARPRILFLVSVSSTGRLCGLFRELQEPGSGVLVVCETSKPPETEQPLQGGPCDDFLVRIPIDRWEVGTDGKCDHCEERGNRVIRVDPVSYERIPPDYEPKLKTLNIERAQAKSGFWKVAHETGAVLLHHWANYSGDEKKARHFSVYLDTLKLAAHPEFREHCRQQVRPARPEVILIPFHSHSEMVRDLCLEACGNVPWFFVSTRRLEGEVLEHLGRADRILVADDAIVTGTTLVNLRAEVFRVTQSRRNSPEVNAFVLDDRFASSLPLDCRNRGESS